MRLFILFSICLLSSNSNSQWINEIHYDNSGTDLNEGVEILAPAGTDLSDFDIVLYNGSDGQTYNTITLSGTVSDQGCGVGTIWFPISGIQNGGPDGIALFNTNTGTLIQFLSYEGTFTASNGVANGLLSEDIGANEGTGTASTLSIQLTGIGSNYSDFTWNNQTMSHDNINPGQTITCNSNTLTISAIQTTPFNVDCNSGNLPITVDISSTGTFNPTNIYQIELSNANGSFGTPTIIGTLNSSANNETMSASVPSNLASGTNYRIRIIASSPYVQSPESNAITVNQAGNCPTTVTAGIILNEFSNGPSGGSKEYYEYAVIGECGSTADIRGFIIDDNNGTFTSPSSYSSNASGIATGHYRFTYDPNWANVPVGSIIVIYNSSDINAAIGSDDETDSNGDYVYILPNSSTYLEACISNPQSNSPDSLYQPCTYSQSGNWIPLSIRNAGDAIQIRNPDGSYYHGVSYGGSEMSGGPHGLKLFNGSGNAMCGWFNDGNYFDILNWSSGGVATNETPGNFNNALNEAWLLEMRDPTSINCPVEILPVQFSFFNGQKKEYKNHIYWQTASERNSSHFILYTSTDGVHWKKINQTNAAGYSDGTLNYYFDHLDFENVYNYYRLEQVDFDGTITTPNNFVAIDNRKTQNKELIKIVNLLGQEISKDAAGVKIFVYSDGTSEKIVTF